MNCKRAGWREEYLKGSHTEAVVSPKRTDLEGIGGNIKAANLKEEASISKRTLKKHPSLLLKMQ